MSGKKDKQSIRVIGKNHSCVGERMKDGILFHIDILILLTA